jgi:hypothetical protein
VRFNVHFTQKTWEVLVIYASEIRRLNHIVPEHLFCTAVASISLYKTMLLSAKCNEKVRVMARKQIIQKPCELL